jgi:hypothetical protein
MAASEYPCEFATGITVDQTQTTVTTTRTHQHLFTLWRRQLAINETENLIYQYLFDKPISFPRATNRFLFHRGTDPGYIFEHKISDAKNQEPKNVPRSPAKSLKQSVRIPSRHIEQCLLEQIFLWETKKASSTLRASQAVPHPSTDRALQRLTSEFERDPVYSLRYGR